MNDFTLDWLLPLEEDDQFVGGLGKKKDTPDWNQSIGGSQLAAFLEEFGDLDSEHPIGGTTVNYDNSGFGDLDEEKSL